MHRPRVLLYSHDTMGLGHMRRNLLVAQTLAFSALRPVVLVVAGAYEANRFAMPAGLDYLTLPALGKDLNGQYRSRHLGLKLDDIVALRGRVIRAAAEDFQPDVFLADNVPRGAMGELDRTLEYLHGLGTRCVLGLRDVLDDPETVRREWSRLGNEETIGHYYHQVWIYGDPAVYDPVREYGLTKIADKVCYTGYLDQRMRLMFRKRSRQEWRSPELPAGRIVLCLVGGGQDGERLAEAFAATELPAGASGILLAGPFMPDKVRVRLHALAAQRSRLRVVDFSEEPTQFVKRADRVIAMGGYNTVCEVLSFHKPALIVPRVRPRREQWIRAQRLSALGLCDVLHPEEVSPQSLAQWLARSRGAPCVRRGVDLNGLSRVPELVALILPAPAGGQELRSAPPAPAAAQR